MHDYLVELLTGPYQVGDPIDPDASFADLGLDSLALVELSAELQDTLGIPIQDGTITPDTSTSALAARLAADGARDPR